MALNKERDMTNNPCFSGQGKKKADILPYGDIEGRGYCYAVIRKDAFMEIKN